MKQYQLLMYLLRCGGQIFFGGVFDKRAGMLFAARRNEDGNVHRRDGVSKTVTKNMWGGFFKPAERSHSSDFAPVRAEELTAVSAVSASLVENPFDAADRRSPLMTNKSSFRISGTSYFSLLMVVTGFQPDEPTHPNPFPDVLTVSSPLPIDTPQPMSARQDNDPTFPNARQTLIADPQLRFDSLLITLVSLLKTNTFCEFLLERMFELRSEVCDMIGHLPFFGRCPFLFYPCQSTSRPPKSPAYGGRRTQKKTAARHPIGLLRAGRFGSIFFTPLFFRGGDVGHGKCKGKLNTFENFRIFVNLPLLLQASGWAKAGKMKGTGFGGFFVFGEGVLRLQKLVHPEGCVLLQLQDGALDKKYDKIRDFTFYSFCTQKGWLLFFGVCFCIAGWFCSLLLHPLN